MSEVAATLWPNQKEIVDGVTPMDDVSQEPYLFDINDNDLDIEMED